MRKRVLLVEDDLDLIDLLKFNLGKAGLLLAAAIDGEQGIKQARAQRPDLILLDLMLPELDGLAVCEILRRDPDTRNIPILILTALPSQLTRVAGLAAGANGYMTKPFKLRELLVRIDELLNGATNQAHDMTRAVS